MTTDRAAALERAQRALDSVTPDRTQQLPIRVLPHGTLGGGGDYLLVVNGRVARARPDVRWELGCHVLEDDPDPQRALALAPIQPLAREWTLRLSRSDGAWAELPVFSVRHGYGVSTRGGQALIHLTIDLEVGLAQLDAQPPGQGAGVVVPPAHARTLAPPREEEDDVDDQRIDEDWSAEDDGDWLPAPDEEPSA